MMDDKDALDIVEKIMADREHITFGISTKDVWLLMSYLQLAYRHPGLSKLLRGHLRFLGDQITQAIAANHPEALTILERGWDSQFDREQGSLSPKEKEWIEGRRKGKK